MSKIQNNNKKLKNIEQAKVLSSEGYNFTKIAKALDMITKQLRNIYKSRFYIKEL